MTSTQVGDGALNISVRELTRTQRIAVERHKAFLADIARKADELRRSKTEIAMSAMVTAFQEEIAAPDPAPLKPVKPDHWFAPADCPIGTPTVEKIQKIVCKYYGISRVDLLSARRFAKIVLPRHVAIYLSRELTLRSLPDIGRRFGGKDHATVLNGVKKIACKILIDADLAHDIAVLTEEIIGTQQ